MTTVTPAPPDPGQPQPEQVQLITPEIAAKMLREFMVSSKIPDFFPHARFTIHVVNAGVAEVEVAPRFRGAYLLKPEEQVPAPGA